MSRSSQWPSACATSAGLTLMRTAATASTSWNNGICCGWIACCCLSSCICVLHYVPACDLCYPCSQPDVSSAGVPLATDADIVLSRLCKDAAVK